MISCIRYGECKRKSAENSVICANNHSSLKEYMVKEYMGAKTVKILGWNLAKDHEMLLCKNLFRVDPFVTSLECI